MKQIVETGTDVAIICFFDPSALPPDFDQRAKDDPAEVIAGLAKEGRIWQWETGADGGYLFHFYIDEELPEQFRPYLKEPEEIARFQVPSGVVWACGAEYAARQPDAGATGTPGSLTKFPHMGGRCEMAPGEYAVNVWQVEWPEGMMEERLESQLGKSAVKGYDRLGLITGVGFLAVLIGTLITGVKTIKTFVSGRTSSGLWRWWGALAVGWIVCVLLMRSLNRIEKNPERKQIEREFPDVVVRMKKIA